MNFTDWFRRVFGRNTSPAEPIESARLWFNPATLSGARVDEDTALTYSAVWACVGVISESIAQLPWRVRVRKPDGNTELLQSHDADRVLYRRPNEESGPFVFKQFMIASANLWGNAYAEIERDASNRVAALWPIMPDRVTPERTEAGVIYRVSGQSFGQEAIIPARNMFHLVGRFSFDGGLTGVSPIRYASRNLGVGIAAEKFGATFFGNNARPGGVLHHPATLSNDALNRLRESFRENYSRNNAHKPLILEEGMTWHALTIPPEDAQFLETRKFSVIDVCRWFNVPPHKVADLTESKYANIEHSRIEFVESLIPWVTKLTEEANYKLISPAAPNVYTHITMQALLRGDSEARSKFYRNMWDMGVMSVNEIRELEDMNRIPKSEGGNKRLVQLNLTTLDTVGDVEDSPLQDDEPQIPLNGSEEDPEAMIH